MSTVIETTETAVTLGPEGTSPRRFSGMAYAGGPLRLKGFGQPVVVDLATLNQHRNVRANLEHDQEKRVGSVVSINKTSRELYLSGYLNAATKWRDDVVQSATDGYQWELSIEASLGDARVETVRSGDRLFINGRTQQGPFLAYFGATLHGVAFVALGADKNTSVEITAEAEAHYVTIADAVAKRELPEQFWADAESVILASGHSMEEFAEDVDRLAQMYARRDVRRACLVARVKNSVSGS